MLFSPPLPSTSLEHWHGLEGSSAALAVCRLEAVLEQVLLVITPDVKSAQETYEACLFYKGSDASVFLFPDIEVLPYERWSPQEDLSARRIELQALFPSLKRGIVIVALPTFLHRLPPVSWLFGAERIFQVGDTLSRDTLITEWVEAGYTRVSTVTEPGHFSVRGQVVDLFPTASPWPIRMEWLDQTIESLWFFDPQTQHRKEAIKKTGVLPAREYRLDAGSIECFRQRFREMFAGNPTQTAVYRSLSEGTSVSGLECYLPLFYESPLASLADYLPHLGRCVLLPHYNKNLEVFWEDLNSRFEMLRHDRDRPLLPPSTLYMTPGDWEDWLASVPTLYCHETAHPQGVCFETSVQAPMAWRRTEDIHRVFSECIQKYPKVILSLEHEGRLALLESKAGPLVQGFKVFSSFEEAWQDPTPYALCFSGLNRGFCDRHSRYVILTEYELWAQSPAVQRHRRGHTEIREGVSVIDFELDDYLLHMDHGVGRYLGLQHLMIDGQPQEFLVLEYADHDKLYVPVHALHLLSRYAGHLEEGSISLHKLGSDRFHKQRAAALESIRDVAADLLALEAQRHSQPGTAYTQNSEEDQAFAMDFPYEETPDQARAIEEILKDLTMPKPMDRLLCGDVGFGKTEVAMRAAFHVARQGDQVAVLVPTTLLAEQHGQSFIERFSRWPLRIGVLSRFREAHAEADLLRQMREGSLDIVIGTHKLLQKGIAFKKLGLLIVDEEHRFGVQQKEQLKRLRANIHILSMTATPIPRTLHQSLSGLRSLSMMTTPPKARLPIRTFVFNRTQDIIADAIQRELRRGGQVFFVHNRVETIDKITRELQEWMPQIRFGIAHGQIHQKELAHIMHQFSQGLLDVLVATTVIEAGIDLPNANTLIIDQAESLGLAQLYQLRGRVGRGQRQAFAYLLVPDKDHLKKDAEKRLEAIEMTGSLGGGFTLATQDLEIRGAGELLGNEQSGHAQTLGTELYLKMVHQAMAQMKEGQHLDFSLPNESIDLHIPALLPEDYLPDVSLRLHAYRRLSQVEDPRQLSDILKDWCDRYGPLPPEGYNLLAITRLRILAQKLGVRKIEADARVARLECVPGHGLDPHKLIALLQRPEGGYQLKNGKTLMALLPEHEPSARAEIIEKILEQLLVGNPN